MYSECRICEAPNNPDVKIWRYMDFTKFVSVLENQALFFPNITVLTDKLEGYLSKASVNTINDKIQTDTEEANDLKKQFPVLKVGRHFNYVCSWHVNEYESAAMWRLYLKSEEGIAIQSTFNRLKESFQGATIDVSISMVKYIDYDKEVIPWNNLIAPALYKRKSFEHERELRAIVFKTDQNCNGMYVPIDVDILIEKIYVAPKSPEWFLSLVRQVVSRYEINKEAIQSSLDEGPLY